MAQQVLLNYRCTLRIVKDYANPSLVIFLDRDAFKSLIPCLGKNISVLLIGWIKNLTWFLTS